MTKNGKTTRQKGFDQARERHEQLSFQNWVRLAGSPRLVSNFQKTPGISESVQGLKTTLCCPMSVFFLAFVGLMGRTRIPWAPSRCDPGFSINAKHIKNGVYTPVSAQQ